MLKVAAVLAALGALVTGQLAFGGTDQAGSWTVWVGEQKKAPAGTPKQTFLNQFFPGTLTINAGDKVTFSSVGFHTAAYTSGKPFPPFLQLPKGRVYENIVDDAGEPFFFDGEQKFEYGLGLFVPAGPKTISRGKFASSGVIVAQNPKKPVTATYTFPQTGKFKMVCLIHPPDMLMNIVVKPKGASVPAAEEVAARAQKELDAAWAVADRLVAQKPPANTIYMGVENAKQPGGRTTVLDFVPNLTTVKAGTSVNFVVKAPTEVHNAAFGPLKYLDKIFKQTDLFPMGPKSPNQVLPFFVFGSDPPGVPYEGRTMHGNGFYATPLLDAIKGAPPPGSYRVRFTTPGKYHFICQLHGPDMAADIRVTK